MSKWKKTTLGNVSVKIGSGATPRGGSNSYKEAGISLIRSQNILDFKFSTDGLAYIDNDQADDLQNVTVEKNDVLLNITGDSVARCCIVPISVLPARVNQHVSIVRLNSEKASHSFIFYLFQSMKEELLMQSEIGATRKALTKGMIESLEILLPPLPEQKAISAVLSSLDDKIDLLHRQNKTLEAMAETLFRQWFIEEAQDDWEDINIGRLGKVITGKTPSTQNQGLWGEAIDFITPTDFKNYGKYSEIADRGLSLEGKEIMKNFLIPANSILVTCIGSDMGKIVISRKECITNQQINSLIIHSKSIYLEYVYQYLKSLYPLLRSIALGGTTMPIINKTDFSSIEISLPPNEKLEEFNFVSSSFNAKIKYNLTQIRTLEKLRDTLLPKLMSGEVRVEI